MVAELRYLQSGLWQRFEREAFDDGSGGGGAPVPTTLFGARCGPAFTGDGNTAADQARVTAAFSSTGAIGVERIFNISDLWDWQPTTGKTVILSVQADPNSTMSGAFDANWISLLNQIKAANVPTFLCPMVQEAPQNGLTQAQTLGAVQHVKTLMGSSYPNIYTGPIFTSFELESNNPANLSAWVNPTYSDWVGIDCYANYGIAKVNTIAKAMQYAINFSNAVGLPLTIPETSFGGGTGHGGEGFTDAQVTQMVSDAIALCTSSNVTAVSWFESNKGDGNWTIEPAIGGHADATTLWKAAVDSSVSAWNAGPWTF